MGQRQGLQARWDCFVRRDPATISQIQAGGRIGVDRAALRALVKMTTEQLARSS